MYIFMYIKFTEVQIYVYIYINIYKYVYIYTYICAYMDINVFQTLRFENAKRELNFF